MMALYDSFVRVVKSHDLLSCNVLVAAVSGGPDSMCLLDLLFRISQHKPEDATIFDTLTVAHFNHQIRKEASEYECRLVREYCEARGILFFSDSEDVPLMSSQSGMSIEHAARIARHRFFERLARDYESDGKTVRIALAHHRQDRAETMMMNVFRGAGLDGLCAMGIRKDRIVRPLIFVGKDQILQYLSDNEINYSIDESNADLEYTRNQWRHVVFPAIEKVSNKSPDLALSRLAEHLASDKAYLDREAQAIFKRISIDTIDCVKGIHCSEWLKLHPAMSSRVLRILYETTFGDLVDFGSNLIAGLVKMAQSGQSNLLVSISGKREAHIDDDVLYFLDQEKFTLSATRTLNVNGKHVLISDRKVTGEMRLDDFHTIESELRIKGHYEIRDPQMFISVHIRRVENLDVVVYNNLTWFGTSELLSGLTLRHPRTGDYFSRAGGAGRKLLRRYLTDMKVPSHIRNSLLVLCIESEVVWIPGLAHARGFVDAISCDRFMSRFRTIEKDESSDLNIFELKIIPDEV